MLADDGARRRPVVTGNWRAVQVEPTGLPDPDQFEAPVTPDHPRWTTELLLAAPDPMLVMDGQRRIVQVNEQLVELLGYAEAELVGMPLERLLPAELRARHNELCAQYLASELAAPMSTGPGIEAVSGSGRKIPIEVNLRTITLPSGPGVLASIRDVTPWLRAERELRDSEQRFRLAFDGAPIAMVMTDLTSKPVGQMLKVNQAMCELMGRSEPALIGHGLSEFTHPDDLTVGLDSLRALASGAVNDIAIEKRYRHADGHDIWVQLSVSLVRDAAGQPSYTLCQLNDITARQQDRADLQQRFELLADNVPVGFALRNLDPPELLYANNAYRVVFDLSPDHPVPSVQEVLAMVHPEHEALAAHMFAQATAGISAITELRLQLVSGERWVRFTLNPVIADGRPTNQIAGVFEDVTERKLAELALRESEQRFVELADSLRVGITLRQLDPPKFLYVNPAFVEISGSNPLVADQPLDQSLSVVHPDDRELVAEHYWKRAQVGLFAESEHRIIRPDGQLRWVRVTSNPVTSGGRIANRCAGTIEDITERKNAETAAGEAKLEAERANAAKDEFLSRMSHELRTPLNAVLGFAQLLELDELTDPQRSSVSHILRGGNHLLAMINDVLDIAGIEADRFEPALEPVPLTEVLLDAIGLMRTLAAASDVSLELDQQPAGAGLVAFADRRRLRQVLLNLLSNAIKYNHPGGRVTVAVEPGPDELVTVRVTDTGIGIPSEDLPRLFTPFDRLGRQASAVEGAGIGLALSFRLVTVMAGRLTVEPAPGGGSTFRASLPRADRGAVPAPQPAAPADQPWSTPPSTVLCIDSDAFHVQLLASILQRRPTWQVVSAAGFAEGLELAGTVAADVILLNLRTQTVEAERQVTELVRTGGGAPVAVLNADHGPRQAERLRVAGAQAQLTEPLDVRQLLAFLDEHTGQRPTAAPDSFTR